MTSDSLIGKLEKRRDGAVSQAVAHSRNKQERESMLMHHKAAVWEQAIDIARQHEAEVIIENDRVCIAGKWFVPAEGKGDPVKTSER